MVSVGTETGLTVVVSGTDLVDLVCDGLSSKHSRRAYRKALTDFSSWYVGQGGRGFSKATVNSYKKVLQNAGLSSSTVNQRLCAVRLLAREAVDAGLIDELTAAGIGGIKGVKAGGIRAGNWLSREQAQALISAPDGRTVKGTRDRAILAVMLGAGLRRSEVAELSYTHIQQREGRWVIVDLVGKGNRVRSVPIPSWTKAALDAWEAAAGSHEGRVFRPVAKGGAICGATISPQAVQDVVKRYAGQLGLELACHDLRRTFAKLAYKGGAGMDQIQLSLGHASIQTTERYLGTLQDLTDAPCDRLGLRLDE